MGCTPSAQSRTQECRAVVKDLFARARALREANCWDFRCRLLLETSCQRDIRAGHGEHVRRCADHLPVL
jgi:hypothetical protein